MLLFIIDISNPALLGSWGSSQWLNSPMITGHLISIEFIHLGILKRWLVCLYTNDQYSRAAVVPVMTLTWWLPYSHYLGGFSYEILIILRSTHLLSLSLHHHYNWSKFSFIYLVFGQCGSGDSISSWVWSFCITLLFLITVISLSFPVFDFS